MHTRKHVPGMRRDRSAPWGIRHERVPAKCWRPDPNLPYPAGIAMLTTGYPGTYIGYPHFVPGIPGYPQYMRRLLFMLHWPDEWRRRVEKNAPLRSDTEPSRVQRVSSFDSILQPPGRAFWCATPLRIGILIWRLEALRTNKISTAARAVGSLTNNVLTRGC